MSNTREHSPRIGITLGDINGIGPEVVIKALSDPRITRHLTPVLYGSVKTLSYYRKNFRIEDFHFTAVNSVDKVLTGKINVINCWEEMIEISAGTSNENGARAATLSLRKAVSDLKSSALDALVTGPINKHNIQSEKFSFPGHTEYLTSEFEVEDSVMLLVSGDFRVGVVTGHIPLKEVAGSLTISGIESKINILERSLKADFGIQKPKIALLGLNPHNGDQGLIGHEEDQMIFPLVERLQKEGRLIFGPFPADGFFGQGRHQQFDAILAMYHDQGLIPFKALTFGSGVNFTAGLPVIRTSPDHGTAFSIAGKGEASEASMREAIYLAYDLWKNRNR